MKTFLSSLILSLIISTSVCSKVYTSNEVKPCEPIDKIQPIFCDMNNIPITGMLESRHENGNLKGEVNFKDGKMEGLSKYYNKNGNLLGEINIKDGKPISGYLYDIDGKQIKVTTTDLYKLIKDFN